VHALQQRLRGALPLDAGLGLANKINNNKIKIVINNTK
jgi:hypothetical protein